MHIFPVFLAWAAERFADLDSQWRQPENLVANGDWLKERLIAKGGMWDGYVGLGIMVFLPAFAMSLVDDALSGLFFGLLELALSTVVLLYCLGPVNQAAMVRELDEALLTGDEAAGRRYAGALLQAEPPLEQAAWPMAIARALLGESAERMFSVVFWFVLLGPVGAVVYRVVALLRQGGADEDREVGQRDGFHAAARQVHSMLAWLPVRLLAGSFALAGRFNETLDAWGSHEQRCPDAEEGSEKGLLICTGCAAAGIPLRNDDRVVYHQGDVDDLMVESEGMRDALGLLERTQVIWLLLLGFLYLAGYAA